MKIVSAQISPIFRAYTQQLRSEYARAGRESQIKQAPARGFETVTLSPEARALAAQNGEPPARSDSERVEEDETRQPAIETADSEEGETSATTEQGVERAEPQT